MGARFVMLDPATLVQIDVPAGAIGGVATVMASGAGDRDTPVLASAAIGGASVAPPSPVHVAAHADGGTAIALRWIRRSRTGWHWIDGIDAALSEETERYAIEESGGAIIVSTVPHATVARDTGSVAVRQIGTYARSRPTQPMSGDE